MRRRRLIVRVGFNLLLGAVFAALASACVIGFFRILVGTPFAKLTIVDVVGIPLLGVGLTGFFVWLTYRFSSEALCALKDLSVEPLTTTDHVYSGRSMEGGDAPPVYYLTVGETEFEVDPGHFRAVTQGDIVRVTYWPNSPLIKSIFRHRSRRARRRRSKGRSSEHFHFGATDGRRFDSKASRWQNRE
ncbi:MAG: hypothetical protein EXR98_21725, partial [Gemmataceae bacterium]|nr:hypothetical protein [Gemmataceae bacterium]